MKKTVFFSSLLTAVLLAPAWAQGLMINTSYGDDRVIPDPVVISLQIEKQIIKVKNDPNAASLELDPSLLGKSIQSASFTWSTNGKTFFCKADNLPQHIVVSKENIHANTSLHFTCGKIK